MKIINQNDDYTQMVETMGRKLTEGGLKDEIISALGIGTGIKDDNTAAGEEALKEYAEPALSSTTLPDAAEDAASEDSSGTGAESAATDDMPEAVSAFLAQQAEYEGYEIPDNVRTDMPKLPFDYVSPVFGEDSSGFGYRLHPIENEIKFHYGTDFAANVGDDVCAFADGYVYAAGTNDSYGNYLILTHKDGYSTVYAHLNEFVAREGDMVTKGQLIGRVGETGNATGPHLHFELLLNDVHLNPEYYI